MFRTTKRTLLYLPINDSPTFHYVAPKSDEPRLILQYVSPAERDRIIANHTTKTFYLSPLTLDGKRQIAMEWWAAPETQKRVTEIVDSIQADRQIVENIWTAITRGSVFYPKPEYIERDERENTAILIDVCLKTIVGWEQVRDDDTGELIPFSPDTLKTFLQEGGAFTLWCMSHVPQALVRFDELLREQRIQAEKNSSGLSDSIAPAI